MTACYLVAVKNLSIERRHQRNDDGEQDNNRRLLLKLNKLMTTRGIQEAADSENSILPTQTKGTEKK